jgi:hypothetical protein
MQASLFRTVSVRIIAIPQAGSGCVVIYRRCYVQVVVHCNAKKKEYPEIKKTFLGGA